MGTVYVRASSRARAYTRHTSSRTRAARKAAYKGKPAERLMKAFKRNERLYNKQSSRGKTRNALRRNVLHHYVKKTGAKVHF